MTFAGIDLLIAVGCIIMVLGFLGCCGAIKESQCMLLMFFIGLLLILILQIVTGILAAVNKSQIKTAFSLVISTNVDLLQSSTEEGKLYQENFQKFEREFQCCGLLNGPEDWGKNFNVPINNYKVCECAAEDRSTDLCTYYRDRYIYKAYCGDKLIKIIQDNMILIMGLTFGVAVIEVPVFAIKIFSTLQGRE
ncbi:TSN8 protein, partial [Eudromia elegans]|nr:TSN8 protein [Eudromia elegans]